MAKQKTELSASLKSDAIQLRKIHEKLQRGFVEGVAELGKQCQEMHDRYANQGDGIFLRVLKEAGIPQRTAYRAMDIARSELASLASSFSLDAAYALTARSVPEAAEDEAIELAKAGEKITPALAREIIKKHSEPETDDPEEEAEPDPEAWLEPLQAPYKAAVSTINSTLRDFAKLAEDEDTGANLAEPWARIRKHLTDAKTAFAQTMPYCECPYCKRKGCAKCRKTGVITKFGYGQLPQEMRA